MHQLRNRDWNLSVAPVFTQHQFLPRFQQQHNELTQQRNESREYNATMTQHDEMKV